MRPKSESSLSAAAAPAAAETVTVFAHTSLDAHRIALDALVGDRERAAEDLGTAAEEVESRLEASRRLKADSN